jgi:DNA-binding transcriptional ArsR family regulator
MPAGLRANTTRALDVAAISARFRVLAVPTRLAMLHALHDGELTVSDLAERVATSQPNVSKHLRVLVSAGFVGRRQEGATTWCRILDPTVFRLCELVCDSGWTGTASGSPLTGELRRGTASGRRRS